MKQPAKVVILPTEKASKIRLDNKGVLSYEPHIKGLYYNGLTHQYQHLYILSDDEEIKEGDWVLTPENKILKFGQVGTYLSKDKKIIATTDSSLHCKQKDVCSNSLSGKCICPDKLPPISESFIKAYIKAYNEGNPITEVQVEYEEDFEEHTELTGNPKEKWSYLKLKEDGSIIIHRAKTYSLSEVVRIVEYIRVGAKSTPDMKTLDLVNEYLGIKENL